MISNLTQWLDFRIPQCLTNKHFCPYHNQNEKNCKNMKPDKGKLCSTLIVVRVLSLCVEDKYKLIFSGNISHLTF